MVLDLLGFPKYTEKNKSKLEKIDMYWTGSRGRVRTDNYYERRMDDINAAGTGKQAISTFRQLIEETKNNLIIPKDYYQIYCYQIDSYYG